MFEGVNNVKACGCEQDRSETGVQLPSTHFLLFKFSNKNKFWQKNNNATENFCQKIKMPQNKFCPKKRQKLKMPKNATTI